MEQAQKDEMEQIQNLANSMNEILGNSENNNTVTPPEPPQDTTPPTITVINDSTTTSTITVNVTSTDDKSGMPSNQTYNYYIKKSADNNYQSSPTHTGTETSYTFTGLTQNTSYDVKVTAQDNAGNLGTGTLAVIKTTTVGGAGDDSGNIGTDTGNITAGQVTWNQSTHKASITLSTSTNLSIQYKVSSSGTWTPTTGTSATEGKPITVSGLNHNDIVYARLIDTAGNYGDEAHLTILDGISPTVTVNKGATTTSTVQVRVTSKDDQSGMMVSPTYSYYIKKSTDSDYTTAPHTGTETSHTFTGLTQNTSYDIKVTTQDNANNTGTGTATNINTTTVEGTTPGLTTGSITAGTATWDKSTHKASVVLSTTTDKTIQYKIGAGGTYTPTSGSPATAGQSVTVSNLNHNDIVYARLVDEAGNYGSEAFITILDGIEPTAPNINLSATNIKAGETLTATVTHTDDQSGVNTANSKYIWNTTAGTLGTTNANWNNVSSFASNPQTITLNTANTGTYYLHVLTTDNAGNKSESVSSAVIIATPTFTADDIANNNNKNDIYGKIVTNYTCQNSAAVANWKIFYAESDFSTDGKNHIYLIADDYVARNYLPKSSAGHALNDGNAGYPKSAYFTNIVNDYTGSASITDARIKKLNNDYFSKGYTSTNNNMKSVAYMCDTNAWSVYKGAKADYAVGTPSVEMVMKSYSQKHNVDYRAKALNATGYQISKDGGVNWESNYSGMLSTRESLYINDSGTNKASGYWIASPSGGNGVCPMEVRNEGTVSLSNYYDGNGFRPLVCLSSDVKLQDSGNGTFAIK